MGDTKREESDAAFAERLEALREQLAGEDSAEVAAWKKKWAAELERRSERGRRTMAVEKPDDGDIPF